MATQNFFSKFIIKLLAGFFYFLTAAAILLMIYAEFNPKYMISTDLKLIYAGIITCSMILATRFSISLCRTVRGKRRASCFCALILFIYYCIILINVLFFDSYFQRDVIAGDWRQNYKSGSNFVPFKTIKLYLNSFQNGILSHSIISANLIGNLLAFAPMGILLPVLYKRLRHFILFAFILLLMVVSVELIQLVTGTGSCDVDDVILNFSGAYITFLLCKLPFMQNFLRKMYLI